MQPAEETSEPTDDQRMVGSEDSDDHNDDTSLEEQPVTPWDELSIVERVGLNGIEMTEAEVETAYSQISLAFHSDRYTLKQRLQAEEHARNLAEENIQLELTRGRETLEALKELCLDRTRSDILQRLQLCLDILGGTVERISSTAELLGAVHQEARVSRAVELMVIHVENLRRRHEQDAAELEETRKIVHSSRSTRRHFHEPRTSVGTTNGFGGGAGGDSEGNGRANQNNGEPQQHNSRRRVSTSVISRQAQDKRKRERCLRKQKSLANLADWGSRKTQLSTLSASTLSASTLVSASTLSASTLVSASTLSASTLPASTMSPSTTSASTLSPSTTSESTLSASTMSTSTALSESTLSASTVSASTPSVSTLSSSTPPLQKSSVKEINRPVVMKAGKRHIHRLGDRVPVPDPQMTSEPPDDVRPAAGAVQIPREIPATTSPSPAITSPGCSMQGPKEEVVKKTQSSSIFPLETLRHRHKSKAVLDKRRGDKDRKCRSSIRWHPSGSQRPLTQRLYYRRWAILCVYLLVMCCVIALTVFSLDLDVPTFW